MVLVLDPNVKGSGEVSQLSRLSFKQYVSNVFRRMTKNSCVEEIGLSNVRRLRAEKCWRFVEQCDRSQIGGRMSKKIRVGIITTRCEDGDREAAQNRSTNDGNDQSTHTRVFRGVEFVKK